jgi:glycosyltransferase involved in cell wall biosynthesis
MKPKITIGVCVRNSAETIPETINSIIKQNYPHKFMEVIFVDDGSEDDTLSVIKEHSSRMDISVKIFHTNWRGLGPARNTVLKNTVGKYIIWVDGDITLPENHVKKQVEFMEQNPDVAIAGGAYELLNHTSLVAFLDNLGYVAYRLRYGTGLPGTGGAIYRVEAIRQIGGFDENIKGAGEDIDVAYRVKVAGWSVVRDNASFYGQSKESWNELFRHYVWHGYGAHYVIHKNKGIISPPMMSPPIILIAGVLSSISVYRLVKQKIAFLLPFHAIFKNVAWWIGFIKGHMEDYGHNYRG